MQKPATSALAERVFNTASNIINKKRARLPPETANLLRFLKENIVNITMICC